MVALSPGNVYPVTHSIGAQMAFLFGSLSCIAGYRITSGPMKSISLVSGLVSLSVYVAGSAGALSVLGPGGIERMIFYPIFLWEICFGGYLLNHHYVREDG